MILEYKNVVVDCTRFSYKLILQKRGMRMKYDGERYSLVWIIFSCVMCVIFSILIWDMLPMDNIIKGCLDFVLIAFILFAILRFHIYVFYFNKKFAELKTITVTVIAFLIIPLVMNIIYRQNADRYLASYPSDNVIAIKIDCNVDRIESKGSVGNEWSYIHLLNDRTFSSGEILEIGASEPFTITTRIIEHDKISDVGETTSKEYIYPINENWRNSMIFSQIVHVEEEGGRKNAGAYADFCAEYTLIRTFPKTMSFWTMLFYTHNQWFPVSLIVCELACITMIVYVIVMGRKKEKMEIEKERQAQEIARIKLAEQQRIEKEKLAQRLAQEKLAQKNRFIQSLDGKSVREVAKVPSNITFVDDFPTDNSDQKYGSYTLYVSKTGTCYHKQNGCCTAHIPIHAFKIQKQYRPCSKCCTGTMPSFNIPKWYLDYIDLKKKCVYYGIDVEE